MLRANDAMTAARASDASDSDGKSVARPARAPLDAVFAVVGDDIDDEDVWSDESERAESESFDDSASDGDSGSGSSAEESGDEMVVEEPFGYEAAAPSAGALLDPEAFEDAPAYKGVPVEPVSLENILPAGSRRRTPARASH